MKFSTIVWGGGNNSPESPSCILETARLYRFFKKINYEWNILVLENYDRYAYIKEPLKDLNCNLIDLSHLFYEKSQEYISVYDLYKKNEYHADLQLKNTIRFLVANSYFGGEPFLNTDADLIINDEPDLIVSKNKSLHMGSTCFVYIKDPDFVKIYEELLREITADPESYIEKARTIAQEYHPGQNAWSVMGPKPNNMSILEEGLFYVLLLRHNLDWKSTNQYLHIPFMYDLYQNLDSATWKRISLLQNSDNNYQFINTKHYINNQPLAYMHYQYNFRFILSFYILQLAIGIPKDSLYCPAMAGDMTPLRKDIRHLIKNHCSAIKNNQKNFRHSQYSCNFVPDILLCQLMDINKHNRLFGTDPFMYHNMIDIEQNGGLCDVLNNTFWYGKNIFI
jgi:hypothetical protein